ncbi:MAG: glycosyltransferase family 4 protein [Thermodesulfobacteriota bacterium]|nr:glycosyltransferase family 4 protein [Thermodesulfobacteriota bacterium]
MSMATRGRRLKIAFVNQPWNSAIPPVQAGSIAIWTYQIARHLSKTCDVVVYGRAESKNRVKYDEGVQYRYVQTWPDTTLRRLFDTSSRWCPARRPLFASRLYYLRYSLQIAKDLRKKDCDVVHLHNFSQFVPIIYSRNPSIKTLLHMHCEWLTQLDRTIVEPRLAKTDIVTGCSKYITDSIREAFPQYANRCRVTHNGVDIRTFSYLSNRETRKKGPRRILFVGRITPEKGLDVLLDAFEKVVAHYPGVDLHIIGPFALTSPEFISGLSDDEQISALAPLYSQNYLTHLRQRATSRLGNKVAFSGFVPHSQLVDHYRNADILVNPSFSESFGMSLIEAMATGLPVVATRAGGMPEVVEHQKTGILVAPGDASALASALLYLLSNDSARSSMARAARKRVTNIFSWESVSAKLLGLYQGMCHTHLVGASS